MNRAEIGEEYDIPIMTQTEEFKIAYRALRNLVDNKDRAVRRLIRGETTPYRRASTKSASTGIESGQESGA